MSVAIYLRKSRADLEAELSGEGNTLLRHRQTLIALAERQHLHIGAIYEEVVSGDTIAARPQMQRLLREVEQGLWESVLVMEIERLARGDSVDQGIVARTFRYSETKIITPIKTYDPNNEFDEEFLEFGLFMSRREYKTIRRRLSAGVQASRREGKFTGSVPPYGYRRQKLTGEKGYTLIPDPDTAPIVQQIYAWFLQGVLMFQIAQRLNAMGIPRPTGGKWYPRTVTNILLNPHYAGFTTNSRRPCKTIVENGAPRKTRPRNTENIIYFEGRHEALISRADWQAAQERLKIHHNPPVPRGKNQTNAFCGLLFCSLCGTRMQRNDYGANSSHKPILFCPNRTCSTVSSSYDNVEKLILAALQKWSLGLELDLHDQTEDTSTYQKAMIDLKQKRAELAAREARAYELVETGVYTPDVYISRKQALEAAQQENDQKIIDLQAVLAQLHHNHEVEQDFIPRVRSVLELYPTLTPHEQNELLKQVIDRASYTKNKRVTPSFGGDLDLIVYPKLPLSPHTQKL